WAIVGLSTNEWRLIRRTLDAPHIAQVFVTLALSVLLQNLALLFWTADFRSIFVPYASSVVEIGPVLVTWSRLINFIIAIVTAAAVGAMLKYTYTGMAIRATAQDRRSARLMGVNVDRIYSMTFALGSALVALAGVLVMPLFPVNPFSGGEFILVAFVVVVLGGHGEPPRRGGCGAGDRRDRGLRSLLSRERGQTARVFPVLCGRTPRDARRLVRQTRR
ncbi:MAG: branched-chain amino acid ABC transporter permease, partial [Hyphomicrobium sp.]|nr:branched-chain amino acid ABC transporter permease [Hyphomicrobium sp.]